MVVALGAQARKAFPTRPGKTVIFTWSVKDPANVEGPADVVQAAFESAFGSLKAQLQELLGAILEEPQTQTNPPAAQTVGTESRIRDLKEPKREPHTSKETK